METKKEDDDWRGCGSEGEDKITGWICDFYLHLGDVISRDSYLEEEVLEASIQITEIGSEKAVNYIISSGIRNLVQDPKTFDIEPIVNYCFYKERHF